jgi:hypothetical protein
LITTWEANVHPTLSGRARLDIATIVVAGAASTAFFLAPLWTSPHSSTAPSREDVQLAAVEPAPDLTIPSAARPRAADRAARARRAPELARAKADVKPERSRLSRLLLGDGSPAVQPFPLALTRSER